jgi:hypothetical protein
MGRQCRSDSHGARSDEQGARGEDRVAILKAWIANEMLVVVEGEDEARIKRKFIEFGKTAND